MKQQKLEVPFIDRLKTLSGVFGIRLGEEAGYDVQKEDGAFQIRQYDDLVVATTTVSGSFDDASEEGFKRLANYIFGHNHNHDNFTMTTPTHPLHPFQEKHESRRIAMTSPVLQEQGPEGWTMSFVLPKREKFTAAPHPDDDRVKLRPIATQTWAVLRYSGKADEKQMRLKARELAEWISNEKSIRSTTDIRWAQFDPPFAIPFLRRNEVQIRVEPVTLYQ